MGVKVTKIGKTGSVRIDMTGLKSLTDFFDGEKYVVRVGILGSKGSSKHQRRETGAAVPSAKGGGHKAGKGDSDLTNADIGLAHEKGIKSRNLPRRSWLEDPLRDHLGEYFQKLGAFAIRKILLDQPRKAYQELAIVCEQIILKGFETNGYGKWKALTAWTIRAKGSSRILVDTAQLKKSITSQVVTV